jgi:regulator of replication initiation timing
MGKPNYNEVRHLACEIIGNKKIDDAVYGYLLLNSIWDANLKMRYCGEEAAAYPSMKKYFEDCGLECPIKESTFKSKMPTIKNPNKDYGVFLTCATIETSRGKKDVYVFKELKPGAYTAIKTTTLEFLIQSGVRNSIKVYAHLLKAKALSASYKEAYQPRVEDLVKAIGYSTNNRGPNNKMMNEVLTFLKNSGLIEMKEIYKRLGGHPTPYLQLVAANEVPRVPRKENPSVKPVLKDESAELEELRAEVIRLKAEKGLLAKENAQLEQKCKELQSENKKLKLENENLEKEAFSGRADRKAKAMADAIFNTETNYRPQQETIVTNTVYDPQRIRNAIGKNQTKAKRTSDYESYLKTKEEMAALFNPDGTLKASAIKK